MNIFRSCKLRNSDEARGSLSQPIGLWAPRSVVRSWARILCSLRAPGAFLWLRKKLEFIIVTRTIIITVAYMRENKLCVRVSRKKYDRRSPEYSGCKCKFEQMDFISCWAAKWSPFCAENLADWRHLTRPLDLKMTNDFYSTAVGHFFYQTRNLPARRAELCHKYTRGLISGSSWKWYLDISPIPC